MKKYIFIGISILILLISYISHEINRTFPDEIPCLTISVDGNNYDAIKHEGNWFNNPHSLGSSYIQDTKTALDKCIPIKVSANQDIKIEISYSDNIKETTLYNLDTTSEIEKSAIENNTFTFKAPVEKGIHSYSFYLFWDNMHDFDYLFKIEII